MKAELKQKWIEALRSGKYRQGREKLKWGGRHCCLGVLCEVAGVEDERIRKNNNGISLPVALGVGEADAYALTGMNDEEGANFREIADWIEANIPASAD